MGTAEGLGFDHEACTSACFQDRRIRPLCHPSAANVTHMNTVTPADDPLVAALVEQLWDMRNAERDVFGALEPAVRDRPMRPNDWSPKDHQAHLTAWKGIQSERIRAAAKGEQLAADTRETDERNAELQALRAGSSWEEIEREADESAIGSNRHPCCWIGAADLDRGVGRPDLREQRITCADALRLAGGRRHRHRHDARRSFPRRARATPGGGAPARFGSRCGPLQPCLRTCRCGAARPGANNPARRVPAASRPRRIREAGSRSRRAPRRAHFARRMKQPQYSDSLRGWGPPRRRLRPI